MNLGKITVITPPDKFFNLDFAYLLVKPSAHVSQQFYTILSKEEDDLNVFVYDTNEIDIEWLLGVAYQASIIVIDIDNCDPVTKSFVSFLLSMPNAFYITNDEITPYHLISKNRIYDLDGVVKQIQDEEDDDNFEE